MEKGTTEEGNIAEFWDNDLDSEEDEEWARIIWEEVKKRYGFSTLEDSSGLQ